MNEQSLVSLAILKANYDIKGSDVIETVIPFVVQILSKTDTDPVKPIFVKEHLATEYGLLIPEHGVTAVLRRMSKRGYFRLEAKQFFRIPGMYAPISGFDHRRSEAEMTFGTVIRKLRDFCSTTHGTEWSEVDAGSALLSYVNQYAGTCLNVAVSGCVIESVRHKPQNAEFLVNSFIRNAQTEDYDCFKYIASIVKATMLANSLYCRDLDQLPKKFNNTAFYLDTTFILRLLGYESESAQAPCKELAELLKQEGGRLRVFEHTRDEVRGIIDASAYALRHTPNGVKNNHPVYHYFLSEGKTESDVFLISEQLEDTLIKHGARIEPMPPRIPQYQIDEHELAALLQDAIHYNREKARDHDVRCITAVFLLRKGGNPNSIEQANSVFVTTNTVYAKVVMRFAEEGSYPHNTPACVGDYDLTNLVWVKRPLAAPDLPEKQMLANCAAAYEPSDELWDRYVEEVDKLRDSGEINAKEHAALRYTIQARTELVDLTQGDLEEYRPGSAKQILERLKEDAKEDADKRVNELADRVKVAERSAAQLHNTLTDSSRNRQRLAGRLAYMSANAVFVVLFLFFLVSTVVLISHTVAGSRTIWISLVVVVAQVVLYIAGLWGLLGGTLPGLVRRLELKWNPPILRLLEKLAGYPE